MGNIEVSKENKVLDGRDFEELDRTFALADSIVTKNYLSQLDTCSLLDTSQEFDAACLSSHASLFRINKIVYDRNENNLQKLVNTYASALGFDSNIVMIINSNGKEAEIYLGITGANEVSSARGSAKALCSGLIGNFPGSLAPYDEIALENTQLESLINNCTKDLYTSVSSVSGVGSPREKEDVANENYIQGMEKLIDTMQGTPFSAVFIANAVTGDQLADIKAEYELLYSKLVPFLKSDLTFSESSAEGISETLSKSLSKTLTKSKSSALSTGISESRAHTEGRAVTHTDTFGANFSVGNDAVKVGGHYSHSISRTKSYSDTATFGTTRAQINTIGDAEAKGEIESRAEGKTSTETTGRTLQITYINKELS